MDGLRRKAGGSYYHYFIGVDPGKSGAIAIVNAKGLAISDHSIRLDSTPHDIYEWLISNRKGFNCFAVLEKVHSRPGQGVSSTFKFGASYGMVKGFLVAAGIPHEEKTPGYWMKSMGLTSPKGTTKTEHKRKLKQKAQELWPQIKITNREADAFLIAEFARRMKVD